MTDRPIDLPALLDRVDMTATGDSNDDEIGALQDALSEALKLLGVDQADHHAPARITTYLVSWSGGYDTPSFFGTGDLRTAAEKAVEWTTQAKDQPGDSVDVLRLDLNPLDGSVQVSELKEADVRAALTSKAGRRQCLYVDETMQHEGGYVPSMVTEGEPGHAPLEGNHPLASPWFFGQDIETAKRLVEETNAKLGITPDQAREIVLSSMAASR